MKNAFNVFYRKGLIFSIYKKLVKINKNKDIKPKRNIGCIKLVTE